MTGLDMTGRRMGHRSRTLGAAALLLPLMLAASALLPLSLASDVITRRSMRGMRPKPKPKPKPKPVPCVPHSPTTVEVGGSAKSWKIPFSWAKMPKVYVGDTLRFSWPAGATHSVWDLTSKDYKACTATNGKKLGMVSPVLVPLTKVGDRYFACGEYGHCSKQKFSIKVLAAPKCSFSPPPKAASPPLVAPPKTIAVGGPNGWTYGVKDTWTAPTVKIGDMLQFQWSASGRHNLYLVSKAGYDSCNRAGGILVAGDVSGTNGGLAIYTVESSAKLYFMCGVGSHCAGGMKVAVAVE